MIVKMKTIQQLKHITMNRTLKSIAAIVLMTAIAYSFGCNNTHSTTTKNNDNGSETKKSETVNIVDGHEYVDLGLPSGTLWATCNVGANKPESFGEYFAWGETQPKNEDWEAYKYKNGQNGLLTKYCANPDYGYNGFIDNLTMLQPTDDAATVNWGSNWSLPTKEQWVELYQTTSGSMATLNGVTGILFSASNGNSLFLPAAGHCYDTEVDEAGEYGDYWSKVLLADDSNYASNFCFVYSKGGFLMGDRGRNWGLSVRAVCSRK